jgi:hypothetical protein
MLKILVPTPYPPSMRSVQSCNVDSKQRLRMTAKQCAAAIRGLEELVKLGFLEVISADDPDKMFLSYSLSKAYQLAAQLFPRGKTKRSNPPCATDTLNVESLEIIWHWTLLPMRQPSEV